ncbi:hypothetical protein DBR40_09175 [Pedobacter sp. KBW01]|uniref:hypothetical protein n=1 Tax=Pedobacter sp. KBW01 TaxID=2153364 RepID=UPI000F59AC36|nr:hypothetical protein [Pedobacter sp. KBW01]RQO78111.1 hypothetical protein DBR40_09175 [Pedobacter sp. KBW01]
MKKLSRQEIAEQLFAAHPNEKGFHFTSDNNAFTEKHKNDAGNHAKTLDDKNIVWVPNPKLSGDDELTDDPERDELIKRYTELYEKAPAQNMKTETLKTKIAEKEADQK